MNMRINMSKVLSFLLIIAAVVYLNFVDFSSKSSTSPNPIVNSAQDNTSAHQEYNVAQSTSLSSAKGNELKHGTSNWVVMVNQLKQWVEDHGYYVFTDKSTEYNSYDDQTLDKLAESGDLRAISMLGDRALKKGSIENAKIYYQQAAIRGSTSGINNLGIFAEPNSLETFDSEEEKNKAYYDCLAFYKVLEMRGDTFMSHTQSSGLIERRGLKLTEYDNDQINKRAKEIYDDMQAKRIQLGLGDFDNTTPAAYK